MAVGVFLITDGKATSSNPFLHLLIGASIGFLLGLVFLEISTQNKAIELSLSVWAHRLRGAKAAMNRRTPKGLFDGTVAGNAQRHVYWACLRRGLFRMGT